jgi:hypothetical protein
MKNKRISRNDRVNAQHSAQNASLNARANDEQRKLNGEKEYLRQQREYHDTARRAVEALQNLTSSCPRNHF